MLTAENIAKINEFLADHQIMDASSLGDKYLPGRSRKTKVCMVGNAFVVLRAIGIDVPRRYGAGGIDPIELAEFRAWKAQQQRIAAE